MHRKSLPIVLVALAVLALMTSSAAFAVDKPAVPFSQEEFVSTLQVQSDAGREMPELEGMQTPILKHGSFCSYQGQGCKRCTLSNGSSGYASCEIQRCLYNGVWHNHFVNCGSCTTACPI